MLWVPTGHQILLLILYRCLNTRPPVCIFLRKQSGKTFLPSGTGSHLLPPHMPVLLLEPQPHLRHSVRGNGQQEAEAQVPCQLSAQHKPDQQFSPPPSQSLTARAPSPLSYFNFTSLIGWQLRAPNECSYFVSKFIPICTQELSLLPFSAYSCTLKISWIQSLLHSCNRQERNEVFLWRKLAPCMRVTPKLFWMTNSFH